MNVWWYQKLDKACANQKKHTPIPSEGFLYSPVISVSNLKANRSLYYRAEAIRCREAILSVLHCLYKQSILSILESFQLVSITYFC